MDGRTEFGSVEHEYAFDIQGATIREDIEDGVHEFQMRARKVSYDAINMLHILVRDGRDKDIEEEAIRLQLVSRVLSAQVTDGLMLLSEYQWDRRRIVSINPGSPYAIRFSESWRYSVYLNGRQLAHALWADEITGQAEIYVMDKHGKPVPTPDGRRDATVTISGDIRIHRKSGPR